MPEALIAALQALPAARPLFAALGERDDVYVVGGAVRDLLLGDAPLDLDLAVEGDAIAVARRLGGELRTHSRFGTATVRRDGHVYDLASARREHYPQPGALPVVEPASIAEDLGRRDFTVNALAVALGGPAELLAVPGAREDLAARRLAVLHERSFRDDPTRLFRLARYAGRLGFDIAPDTDDLARRALADGALGTVSGDRIGHELRLLAAEPRAPAGFAALAWLGLDTAVHPRFGIDDAGRARTALAMLPAEERRDRLVLALAGRRLAGGELRGLLTRLGVRGADAEVIVASATGGNALAAAMAGAGSPAELADAVGGAPLEAVALAGALGAAEAASAWLEHGRHVGLAITGEDLLSAGVRPGPAVGRGLRAALAAKRDGRARDRAAELAVALAAAADSLGNRD